MRQLDDVERSDRGAATFPRPEGVVKVLDVAPNLHGGSKRHGFLSRETK
jgi:hypothetical protein